MEVAAGLADHDEEEGEGLAGGMLGAGECGPGLLEVAAQAVAGEFLEGEERVIEVRGGNAQPVGEGDLGDFERSFFHEAGGW